MQSSLRRLLVDVMFYKNAFDCFQEVINLNNNVSEAVAKRDSSP